MGQAQSKTMNSDDAYKPNNLTDRLSVWPPRLLPLAIGGLLGSLVGWACMRTVYPIFEVPEEIALLPSPPPNEAVQKLEEYLYAVGIKNYAIALGVMGLSIGVCCAAFTVARRHPLSLVLSGLLGAALAAVGGVLCHTMVTHTRLTGANDLNIFGIVLDSMKQAILAQASVWGLLGLGVGAGLGLGARGMSAAIKSGISGMLGGVAAATIFLFASAFLFPNTNSNDVWPKPIAEQIAWAVVSGLLVAVSIALGSGERKKAASHE